MLTKQFIKRHRKSATEFVGYGPHYDLYGAMAELRASTQMNIHCKHMWARTNSISSITNYRLQLC